MFVIVSSSTILSLPYYSFIFYPATVLSKVTRDLRFACFSFVTVSIRIHIKAQTMQLQCRCFSKIWFWNFPCSVSSIIHRTVVLYSVLTKQQALFLSYGFRLCGTTEQYGWGFRFPGFGIHCSHLLGILVRGASPGLCLHRAPRIRTNGRHVPILREKLQYSMAVLERRMESSAWLWSAYGKLNGGNCPLVRVIIT
jgi:hypothetical protein